MRLDSLIITFMCCMLPVWPSLSHAANSLEYEFDPYYSNLGYYISLTDDPIPEVEPDDEGKIYGQLLSNAFNKPRFMLVEASVNPLPMLGVYLKRNHRSFYDDAEIRSNINLIQTLTEGFEEPYAISFFAGSIVRFVEPGQSVKSENKGYSGFLLSVGSEHIVNNELVDDNWYELEWKIKGDQNFDDKKLSWSLRVGTKHHQNPFITDVIHFGIRRNHFDVDSDDLHWFDNSDIDYKIALDKDDLGVVQQSLFINKKWVLPGTRTAFELGVGFILEQDKYTGGLKSEDEDFRLIIRPSFSF